MTRWICVCAISALCAAPAVAVATDRASVRATGSAHAAIGQTPAARTTSIVGAAWQGDDTPIANARLRLRDVTTGHVEATTVANEFGRFTFTGIEGGSYVVELVSDSGKILTVGHVFAINSGETVATFVRLGTHVPWFTSFFSNAAAAAATVAAAQGVTALAPTSPPASRAR